MNIYKEARINKESVILDGKKYDSVMGKHCVWIPEIQTKLVLSFHGGIDSKGWMRGSKKEQINKFTFNDKNSGWSDEALTSLVTEFTLLETLWVDQMAPKPMDYVFIKNVTSNIFTIGVHCDSQGWYGYEVMDASKLPAGKYSFDKFDQLYLKSGIIQASQGALGDLAKKEGNLVNGYLVDVRRSLFDMMVIADMVKWPKCIPYKEDINELKRKCRKYGQFPFQERSQNYQSYWLNGDWVDGTRKIPHRFDKMQLPQDFKGKSVLDLGCQMGSMAMEAWRRGARKVTGLEYQSEFVDCARDIARANGFYVNFQVMDLTEINRCSEYIKSYYPEGVDIVFGLSLYKHIKRAFFDLMKEVNFKTAYIESHNTGQDGLNCGHVQEMIKEMTQLGWNPTHLGYTEDRSRRAIWRIDK